MQSLVAISPTSTAVRSNKESCNDQQLICLNSYIFRTAPNDLILIRKLIKKIPRNIDKIAIVYEGKSPYSRLFKLNFTDEFSAEQGGKPIVNEEDDLDNLCNFSTRRGFDVENCLEMAKKRGANAILLVPSTKNAQDIQEVIEKNYNSETRLDILGSDSMYKNFFVSLENIVKTEGMLIAVPWHRYNNICENTSNRLECKAARLLGGSSLIGASSESQGMNPMKISWRTATAYDATIALMNGLQQASEKKLPISWF